MNLFNTYPFAMSLLTHINIYIYMDIRTYMQIYVYIYIYDVPEKFFMLWNLTLFNMNYANKFWNL